MAAKFQDQMTCIALVEPDAYPFTRVLKSGVHRHGVLPWRKL